MKRKNKLDNLYNAFSLLKNKKEIAKFLRDLLTMAELKEFSKRLEIANFLNKGEMSYKEIAKKVKTSTTTVTRVAHWLNHGKGGYKLILKRLV